MLRNAKDYLQINDVQDTYIDTYILTYILTYIDKRRELLMNSTLTSLAPDLASVGVLRSLEVS